MAVIRSRWADDPIVVGEGLEARGWAGAAEIPLGDKVGSVLVKNDAAYLYVAFDVVADTAGDAEDYFWFVLDADGDGQITPNQDRLYSPWRGKPTRLGKAYLLGPGRNTTLQDPSPGSEVHPGFGPSPAEFNPHRTWEMRLPLTEVEVSLGATSRPPVLHVGFRVGSPTPPFIQESPAGGVVFDLSEFHRLVLATRPAVTYPPGTEGAVIGGIGLIPAGLIGSDAADTHRYGRATTLPSYAVPVSDAAFGGPLNVIGNRVMMRALWDRGARRYRVLHRHGESGPFTPMRQAWVNFRTVGDTSVPESFGADSTGTYAMTDPDEEYSIDDLLVAWPTESGYPAGIHQLRAEFLAGDGSVVATPTHTLSLRLANRPPAVALQRISRGATTIQACQQVVISDAEPTLEFEFSAEDQAAGLAYYELVARWGEGDSHVIAKGSYVPPPPWDRVHEVHTPKDWEPPVSCAYAFEVSASSRITNGYAPSIRSQRVSRFVTIVVA